MARNRSQRTVVSRILTYAPVSVVPAVLALITTSIFTRTFSASDYGRYSLFLIVANLFRQITVMWLLQAVGRMLPAEGSAEGKSRIKLVTATSTWTILMFDIVVILVATLFIMPRFDSASREFFLPLFLYVLLSSVFDIVGTTFPAEMRASDYVTFRLVDSIATFILRLLLVFVVVHMNIRALIWSVVISNAILIPLMWFRGRFPSARVILSESRSKETWAHVSEFLAYGLPMTIWYFASMLLDVGDRYVLSYYLGPREVGIYDVNYRLLNGTIPLIVIPVTLTLHPYLMSLAGAGDKQKIGEVIQLITEVLIVLGTLAVGLMIVFHRDIARFLLGRDFREGSIIMPAVLAGMVFSNTATFLHKPFEISKKIKAMIFAIVASAVVNVGLNFLLIPVMGYMGAAYATVVAYAMYALLMGGLGRRLIPWSIAWRSTAPRLVAIAGAITAVWFLRRAVESHFSYVPGLVVSLALGSLVAVVAVRDVLAKSSRTVQD